MPFGRCLDCRELDLCGIATWYGAAILGGVLILLFERLDRRRKPSDADVRQAATRYREW